jgi:hypothetical protein
MSEEIGMHNKVKAFIFIGKHNTFSVRPLSVSKAMTFLQL